ncbi:MAG: hypothetical protein LBD04_01730 [Synergistaceae bacterium]|nr:hypothetical protein [Synergistaceae bacterium]
MPEKWRGALGGALLLLAIAFVLTGLARGEPQIVFIKAVRICLECIGIG